MRNPVSLALNPIFEREFVGLCRTKRWFVTRAVFVAAPIAVLWIALFGLQALGNAGGAVGSTLFTTLAIVEVFAVGFATPALTVDAVVSERTKETLDLLLTTPLSAGSILAGKFFSRILLVVVMAAATFPIIAVSLLYGGVRAEQLLDLFQIVVATILFTGGIALFVSTYSRRLGTAATLAYVLPLSWIVGEPLFLAVADVRNPPFLATFLTNTHPLFATLAVAGVGPFSFPYGETVHGWFLASAGVAAACFFLSWIRLRAEGRDLAPALAPRETKEPAADPIPRPPPSGHPMPVSSAPLRPVRKRRLPGNGNPMLWKEGRLIDGTYSRALFWVVFALLSCVEIIFVWAISSHFEAQAEPHIFVAVSEVCLLSFLVAVNASTGISVERQRGTLDLVHVTLLTPSEIVLAKVLGSLRSILFLLLFPFVHIAIAALVTPLTFVGALLFYALSALQLTAFALMGTAASIAARRPSRAILRATARFALVLLVPPLACGLFGIFVGGFLSFSDEFITFLNLLILANPPVLLFSAVTASFAPRFITPGLTAGIVSWTSLTLGYVLLRGVSLPRSYMRARLRQGQGQP